VSDRLEYLTRENRRLRRQVAFLEPERHRLELLLADASNYAGLHTGCRPATLLGVFATTHSIDLARPAWVEQRDRERQRTA
jgi:hypothetical protein